MTVTIKPKTQYNVDQISDKFVLWSSPCIMPMSSTYQKYLKLGQYLVIDDMTSHSEFDASHVT